MIHKALVCPACGKALPSELHRHGNNFTLDCPNGQCSRLLLFDKGQIWDFHKKLHAEDARWPADGVRTMVISFDEEIV